MIRAMIIDDEKHSCEALQILLQENCPQVIIAGLFTSSTEALERIKRDKPDLVFLDIEMPHINGFELLGQLTSIDFDIIFTTSYNQYAIKAFKFSAIDYLLKPIDREELMTAVDKVVKKQNPHIQQQLEMLLYKIKHPTVQVEKIALPTMQGLELVLINSIICCAANSNYTEFTLGDKKKMLVSRTLKEVEELLGDHAFVRVHNSYIVNINAIIRYIRGEGGYLIMSDGSKIDVSRSRKELLIQKLQHH